MPSPSRYSKWLITGDTGTLGLAIRTALAKSGIEAVGASRRGSEYVLDLTDPNSTRATLDLIRPDVIINTAALTSVDGCQRNPKLAAKINAESVGLLATYCAEQEVKLVQISTDHLFQSNEFKFFSELSTPSPINIYAATKLKGEGHALSAPGSIVIRTNFCGFRNWPNQPNFLETIIYNLENSIPITGFTDYFTSTIDTTSLSQAIIDLTEQDASGVINIASSEAFSKFDFIMELARTFELSTEKISRGSVDSLAVPRSKYCALEISKSEQYLGYQLPNLVQVVATLRNLKPIS